MIRVLCWFEFRNSVATYLVCCYFFCGALFAAEPLNYVVGLVKPPYVFPNAEKGLEVDIISQVTHKMGREAKFVFIPYKRSERMFQMDNVDALMTVNSEVILEPSSLTDAYIAYDNVAVTLKSSNIHIEKVSDLANFKVSSFQMAHQVLGKGYANTVANAPLYLEIEDQTRQVQLLYDGKVDVLVIDVNIFNFIAESLNKPIDVVELHSIFPKNLYQVAFKDKNQVKAFNKAFNEFKNSSEYKALLVKYQITQ